MKLRRWLFRGIALGWFVAGSAALTNVGLVQAKAHVAQWLVARSWDTGVSSGKAMSPWPWSDARVVARLEVPALNASSYVFDSDSPAALAFGPGWSLLGARGLQAPPPNADLVADAMDGALVISAHRDTHFNYLGELKAGMPLQLSTVAGFNGRWQVDRAYVVDSRHGRLGFQVAAGDLLLVTCYPLDAWVPGGPLRLVVHATPAGPELIQGEQLTLLD